MFDDLDAKKVDETERQEPIGRLKSFQGKRSRYSKKIIMKLLYGLSMTTNELALIISQEEGSKYGSVYSVISRPKGALKILEKNWYIRKKDKKAWELTEKGFLVALTQTELKAIWPKYEQFFTLFNFVSQKNEFGPTMWLNKAGSKALINYLTSQDFLQYLRNYIKGLIDKGVDLDEWDEITFLANISSLEVLAFVFDKIPSFDFKKNVISKLKKGIRKKIGQDLT